MSRPAQVRPPSRAHGGGRRPPVGVVAEECVDRDRSEAVTRVIKNRAGRAASVVELGIVNVAAFGTEAHSSIVTTFYALRKAC